MGTGLRREEEERMLRCGWVSVPELRKKKKGVVANYRPRTATAMVLVLRWHSTLV